MTSLFQIMGYSNESLKMLESKEGQLNAVFACYGSAAQHCQYYEAALEEFLIVYNKISKKSLSLRDLETIETKLRKKTIGALLQEFRNYVTVNDDKIEQSLHNALEKRNFLIHGFFRQREGKFRSKEGRIEMLAELIDIEKELKRATDVVNGMRVALLDALDLKSENRNRNTEECDTANNVLFTIDVELPE